MRIASTLAIAGAAALLMLQPASAAIIEYGDRDIPGIDYEHVDPLEGTTRIGLLTGQKTFGPEFDHEYPFAPEADDIPGMDRIYRHGDYDTWDDNDGYSTSDEAIDGPQTISLNYASLVPQGHRIVTFTLGLAADDFERPRFDEPFYAKINGLDHADLTYVLNNDLDLTFPQMQYFTLGLNPSLLSANHTLQITIDQGGNGGDGWAVDFATIGVTTEPIVVPEPAALSAMACASLLLLRRRR